MAKFISFLDYIFDNETHEYHYYREHPNYIFSDQLAGGFMPFHAIKMDILNTNKPYRSKYTVVKDIIQPVRGVLNIVRGLFNIVFVPVVILLRSIWQLVNLKLPDIHVTGIQLTTWFIEGIAYLFRGIFQVISTPFAWLRIPVRGVLTAMNPVIEEGVQEKLPRPEIDGLPDVLLKHVFSYVDGGTAASARSTNRFFDLHLTHMMQEEKYYPNRIISEISSTLPKSEYMSLSNYYRNALPFRRIVMKRVLDSKTTPHEFNHLFGQALNAGYDHLIPLLKNKINPKTQLRNKEGLLDDTFVHLAAEQGYIEILTWLLEEGAPVDARNVGVVIAGEAHKNVAGFGATPLFRAASAGHLECLKLLLEYGANVNARRLDFRQTPLHYAASSGHLDCVITLIDAGANLAARDQTENMPLQSAQNGSHEACVAHIKLKMEERHMAVPPLDKCSLM